MFVELGIVFAALSLINYVANSEERKLKSDFKSVMEGVGLSNKLGDTFTLEEIEKAIWGYKAHLNIPRGLSVEHLRNKTNILEDNLHGVINFKKDKFKNDLTMYFINKDVSKFLFEPVKTQSNQLYIGKNYKLDNYFLDLDKHPMILIAGATGYGKSMLLASILTNLIYNNSDEAEIYLTQLIKGEISSFENCKPVKFSAYTQDELIFIVKKIRNLIDTRTEKLKNHGIRNINQFNKHFPRNKIKRVFLVCEEFSELMNLPIWEELWGIVKAGRSVGIHLIGVLQRTTATNLDTNVKSQMTRITFHQNSVIDSQNVINSNSAMNLNTGECIVCGNNGEELIKVPFIDDDFAILNKYVPDISIPTEEAKQEIINIKKEKEKIVIEESPRIVEVEYKSLPAGDFKKNKGILSNEEDEEDLC